MKLFLAAPASFFSAAVALQLGPSAAAEKAIRDENKAREPA